MFPRFLGPIDKLDNKPITEFGEEANFSKKMLDKLPGDMRLFSKF
jgi:hypothetical protein